MKDGWIKKQGNWSASGLAAIEILRGLDKEEITRDDYDVAKGHDSVPYAFDTLIANGLVRHVRKEYIPGRVIISNWGRTSYYELNNGAIVSDSDMKTLYRIFGERGTAGQLEPKSLGRGYRKPSNAKWVFRIDWDACEHYETVARAMVEVMRMTNEN